MRTCRKRRQYLDHPNAKRTRSLLGPRTDERTFPSTYRWPCTACSTSSGLSKRSLSARPRPVGRRCSLRWRLPPPCWQGSSCPVDTVGVRVSGGCPGPWFSPALGCAFRIPVYPRRVSANTGKRPKGGAGGLAEIGRHRRRRGVQHHNRRCKEARRAMVTNRLTRAACRRRRVTDRDVRPSVRSEV